MPNATYLKRAVSREDATKKFLEDYSQSSQHFRAAAQYGFVVNAGAAAAVLTFLTAITTAQTVNKFINQQAIVGHLAAAASFYLLGALLVLVALHVATKAKEMWGHYWEDVANEAVDGPVVPNFADPFAAEADRLINRSSTLLIVSFVLFVVGSASCISGFLR